MIESNRQAAYGLAVGWDRIVGGRPRTIGTFRFFFADQRWEWSDEVAQLHGYAPGTVQPTTELLLSHKHPDDREAVAGKLATAVHEGTAFCSRHRIIDAGGIEHHVLVVGDRLHSDSGATIGTAGYYIDLDTALDDFRKQAIDDTFPELVNAREQIEQAKSALMLVYGIGAEQAFAILRWRSQETNTKLRTGLAATALKDKTGATVGLTCEILGRHPGPRWVLDACLDTAPFGDEAAWTHPPTSAAVVDGWLHGRGSADCKSGAAIFCHIAARLAAMTDQLHGRLVLLFDVDEHTGAFGGAKRYFEGADAPDDVADVMIGYPGIDDLVVGGRGVHRAKLHVHGVASHSGGRKSTPNAIAKAADLVGVLTDADPSRQRQRGVSDGRQAHRDRDRGRPGLLRHPRLVHAQRRRPHHTNLRRRGCARLLKHLVAHVDDTWPDTQPTLIQVDTRWPAFVLAEDSRLRTAILDAATAHGATVNPKVAGPSNIANYLAGLSIPATAGFGVDYLGLHATDERIRVDTIATIQAIYHAAVLTLRNP